MFEPDGSEWWREPEGRRGIFFSSRRRHTRCSRDWSSDVCSSDRVSLDAATRETYRRLRGVDQFDRVVANVRRLVELERERGRSVPRVSLWFTASRANLDELSAFVQLAADLGVDEVYVQRLVFNGLGLATAENALHGRLHRQEHGLLDQAAGLAHALGPAPPASGVTPAVGRLPG